MATANNNPTAFISYSWDSDDHKIWVRELGEQLRTNGVDVRLDQWHIAPGQSLTQFMEAEVQGCDFVLVVCSRDYARKSAARAGGVGYEQQIISGNIAAGVQREKFIPIIRDGSFVPGPECAIPPQFLGIYAVDMRDDAQRDKTSEQLLRAIYGQPALVPPALGPRPAWADAIGLVVAAATEPEVVRLPSMELDGWHLESGVVRHEANPDTFEIPDEAQRRNLAGGDIVKLIFEIEVHDADLGPAVERMWVLVHDRAGPYYVGELNNHPASSDEQDVLRAGDRVVFLPEHVISIIDDGGEEIEIAEPA